MISDRAAASGQTSGDHRPAQGAAPVPDVSIIIVNWNTRELLRECLQSIERHAGATPIEVIVVDNGSADGSAEMVAKAFPQVRLIGNPDNRGFARANNQGIAIARGRYVLLLNSDTQVLEGTLERSLRFADAHPEAAVVGCRTTFPNGQLQINCYQFPRLLNLGLSLMHLDQLFPRSRFFGQRRLTYWGYDTPREVDAVAGCFMLTRAEAIRQVGPLAEDYFMYSEDTDWCWRFAQAGWKVMYTPEAALIHVRAASSSKCETEMRLEERRSLLMFLDKRSGRFVRRTANMMFLCSSLARVPLLWAGRLMGGARGARPRKQWPLTKAALRFHLWDGLQRDLRERAGGVPPETARSGPQAMVADR